MARNGWTKRIGAWLGRHPTLADALLPLGVLFLMNLSGGASGMYSPGLLFTPQWSWSAELTCMALLGLPVAFRRSHPKAAALSFVGIALAQIILGPVATTGDLFALVMLYSALVYGAPKDTALYAALAFAMGTLDGVAIALATNAGSVVNTLRDEIGVGMPQHAPQCATMYRTGLTEDCARVLLRDGGITTAMIWLVLGSVVIIALWNRARRATVLAMQERNAALEASEAEERRIAASAERARIARDMHDVVAHTLSIIIIQSDGGRYAGAHDPAVARSTMETIRRESERALNDMKRLLGVFGGSAHAGYADIDSLVATADAALEASGGGSVARRVTGTANPTALGAQAGVAVYRLVQEALTNARKYAGPGARVSVEERWDANGLAVAVTDDGRGAAAAMDGHQPGYGLIGMHERIAAVGGTVSAGPRIGGGYEVRAWVPFGTDAPQTAPISLAGSAGSAGSAEPAGSTAPTAVSSPAVPVAFTARIRETLASLRSKPINSGSDAGGGASDRRSNIIERLSRWTERHYLLMDSVAALALFLLCMRTSVHDLSLFGNWIQNPELSTLIITVMTGALAFRRRFPEGSAAVVAGFAALQLLVMPDILYADLFALGSLYAAIVYGREQSWRWITAAAMADSLLAGVKFGAQMNGYDTLAGMLWHTAANLDVRGSVRISGIAISYGIMVAVLCAGTIALGRWTRSRGSNALVLQMREDALRAEQAKQKVLAANMERNRIGAAIQAEVTTTLTGVINQADAGLAMLDTAASRGETPSPEAISNAFDTIGKQGRSALAHMRQLLGVLRETGSTDEAHRGGIDAMRLAPAASLDEQMSERMSHAGR
ncbi:DUF7134 domain-containing protein [Bifidobacterium avesanii]|uniref:histidine kinase n=1 Tax=Bifidobacterium avesanii TaxID=1798157 RepID=A0A7K3THM7_9BIFI|nr:histidine kinase [Bifidobacterium avesanii]KAB8292822.1 two-component sensor kinase [Bifidobacterium avesanii]NEG78426.1 sensor histidine kinase [Bifidobacterium avesanii]